MHDYAQQIQERCTCSPFFPALASVKSNTPSVELLPISNFEVVIMIWHGIHHLCENAVLPSAISLEFGEYGIVVLATIPTQSRHMFILEQCSPLWAHMIFFNGWPSTFFAQIRNSVNLLKDSFLDFRSKRDIDESSYQWWWWSTSCLL